MVLDGAPLAATTNAEGLFAIQQVPPGVWTFRVSCSGYPIKRGMVGTVSSQGIDVGTVIVGKPGAITGKVSLASTSDYDNAMMGIPALGLYTQLNVGGFYLLGGVAPGTPAVFLYVRGKTPVSKGVAVANGGLATLDFLSTLANPITLQ
jgi:hypothetical protein